MMQLQQTKPNTEELTDLLIVGGGINGAGIAADAVGRGLSVRLCEQKDFASATSSASSKLIHGGLRYLEHYEFRLVREALAEREVLLHKAPHLIKPMRFVLPHRQHLRPAWMIRCGLFLYDHLGGRKELAKSRGLKFNENSPLKSEITKGFDYADCWVDDARLVISNILAAQEKGAHIHCYTKCIAAEQQQDHWLVTLEDTLTAETFQVRAKCLVNASGPWAQQFLETHLQRPSPRKVKLIKGSHIIVPRLHEGEQAYILQNEDKRVIFVIPYLEKFSLIGTTDKVWQGEVGQVAIDEEEKQYLVDVVNKHFANAISTSDIVHHYSGVRPLCDDESTDPSAMTRDYTLEIDDNEGKAPLLSIFGGKITTYRRLAESALEKLVPYFSDMSQPWTKENALPGGDLYPADVQLRLRQQYPWLPTGLAHRITYTYGSRCFEMLEGTTGLADLGACLGADLFELEVQFLVNSEWARSAEDILFRRTKLGITLTASERDKVESTVSRLLSNNGDELKKSA